MRARFPEHEALVRNFVKGVEVVGRQVHAYVPGPHPVGRRDKRGNLGILLSSPARLRGIELHTIP